MSIASNYLDPPPGAPVACKSLGTVTFHDMAENKHIIGSKSDLTWADISKHIHVRELTDAIAGARREMAEALPEVAASIRVRMADLSERAKKWGIAVKVPEDRGIVHAIQQDIYAAAGAIPNQPSPEVALAPIHTTDLAAPASRDAPWLGAPVMFITNPGEQIGGMQEIVGWCVKIYSHDRISIFMTPDHSEPSYRDNLPRRGSPAGNGKVHQFNCWDFNPEALRQKQTMDEMFLSITRLVDRIEVLELHAKTLDRQPPEEAPKRRNRPPKQATETGAELADETDKPSEKPEGSEAA
jgi:hypothetical protein